MMTSRSLRPALILSAAATLLHGQAPAENPARPEARSQTANQPRTAITALVTRPEEPFPELNLPSTPLNMVVLPIEELTGRTVLRQQGLPNPEITLVFRNSPTRAEAMQALESVLNLNQIALVPLGEKFVKMIPLPSVRMEAPELIEGSTLELPPSGRIASKLFRLNFLQVNEFIPQISPLLNANIGNYATFDKANSVLVTDSIANLQRVETLIAKLDGPLLKHMSTRFYPLRNAKASDLVNKLRTILQGPLQMQMSTATTYSADDRTNQIILISDERQFPLFDDLIAKLDLNADPNTRNEVIPLKHATAKDVASLLSTVVSGQNKANSAENATVRSGLANNTQQPAAGQTPSNLPAPTVNATGEGTSAQFSELITIQADERSNALILSGPVDDIRMLKALIEKIDVVLPQVLIEVVIAEVTLNDSDSTGLRALNLDVKTNEAGRTSITNFAGNLSGWTVSSGVVEPLAFSAAMQTVGTKGNVKILSAPTIMTMHNKEGIVTVGEKRPLITSTTSTPIASSTPVTDGFASQQNVTYTDIAIELKVTPLIGEDGSIQLKIDQKVDDQLDTVQINGNDQPVIGHRQASSSVNVRDGEMVVLGGLQRTRVDRSRSKLGLLFEIPVISQILGGRTNRNDRTELLLFIRPKVVRLEDGGKNAHEAIEKLSNKQAVRQFLEDPDKPLEVPLIERIK